MEELNIHMTNLDTMIDDLQKFQHEISVDSSNQQAVWIEYLYFSVFPEYFPV